MLANRAALLNPSNCNQYAKLRQTDSLQTPTQVLRTIFWLVLALITVSKPKHSPSSSRRLDQPRHTITTYNL